jgi:hypothetical protein
MEQSEIQQLRASEQLNAMLAVVEGRLTEIEKRLGIVNQGRFTGPGSSGYAQPGN